jgi:NAD(P)-dependent dehydrogenase (short-subunit alcohol dehydrogenase family)
MAGTILITGASSGIGRATALHFHQQGWNVVASMRNPEQAGDLASMERVLVTRLDVTDEASIAQAIAEMLERFGGIDVLVNNAGFGAYGPLEITSMDVVRRQFDTNVIGLMAVSKAVLPVLRQQGGGVIVNISSVGGRMTFPLGSLYHGSKFAVEGLSEALVYELAPLGIKVKLIEPGFVETDFAGRSFVLSIDPQGGPYEATVSAVLAAFDGMQQQGGSPANDVARLIYDAATDGSDQLRYVVGADACATLQAREQLDDDAFMAIIRNNFGLLGS